MTNPFDEELQRQVQAAEAAEEAERGDRRSNTDMQIEAAEAALARDDDEASGLVGGQVGNLRVLRREKPGKRWVYVCRDRRDGREVRLRGYQLVRAVRAARNAGLAVTGLREPWRDERPVQA